MIALPSTDVRFGATGAWFGATLHLQVRPISLMLSVLAGFGGLVHELSGARTSHEPAR
jgi:hypothetical protein